MCTLINIQHAGSRNVGVDLRSRKMRMPEQFLNIAQVCAVIQQVRGKAVSQRMRSNFAVDGGLLDVLIDQSSHTAVCQRCSTLVDEDVLRAGLDATRTRARRVAANLAVN